MQRAAREQALVTTSAAGERTNNRLKEKTKMNKPKRAITAVLLAMIISASAAAASATTLRAFVSSTGNDANVATNCVQSSPCRTFAAAYPTVTAGGELIALDTAGYGPLTGANTINKAITIATVPGAMAFVVAAAGTSAFTVSAGASDLVVLRNINFNGSGAANTIGVNHTSGKLIMDNCRFSQLTTGFNEQAKTDVINCDFSNNGTGIISNGAGTEATLDLGGVSVSTAQVRLRGGNITANTVGITQANPGNDKFNVFVFASPIDTRLVVSQSNLVGNGTNINCTGTCNTGGGFGMFIFGSILL
jgi:hypothetical protein